MAYDIEIYVWFYIFDMRVQDIYVYKKFCYTFTCHFNVLYSRLLFYPVWILALARSYKGCYIRQQRAPGLIVSFRKLLILLTTVPKEKENFSIISNAKSNNASIIVSANKVVRKSYRLNGIIRQLYNTFLWRIGV